MLFSNIGKREGFTVLPGGKYGTNNGFDLVLQGSDGSVTILLEAKQMTNGAIKLDPNAAGNTVQMSKEWIETVLSRLPVDSPARIAVERAKDAGTLLTAVGGVNKTTGVPVVVPITVPKLPSKGP